MIKAVLFDLDGTLYDRDALVTTLFDEQYAAFADELRSIPYERFVRDAVAMDDHGYGVKEVGYRALVSSWGLVSEEAGVRKPEIFRRALTRCDVAAHEALFVGDHPVVDVEGAHRAGLTAVWKYVPYWPPVITQAPTVRELSEVLQWAA